MKLNTQSIIAQLEGNGVALQDRSYLISVALGRAIGYHLPLPNGAVENPYLAFTTQHKAGVEALLSQVNERIVVDIDATADLVCRLWVFRYRIAFDPNNAAVRQFLDAMVKVGNREIPPKLSEWLIRYESNDAVEQLSKFISASLTETV